VIKRRGESCIGEVTECIRETPVVSVGRVKGRRGTSKKGGESRPLPPKKP